MKKGIIIIIFTITFIVGIVVGYFSIAAREKIEEPQDILAIQFEIDKKLNSYGYTIDEPNVVLNPYEISPLTALIMFETKDYVAPTVTVLGKSAKTTFQKTFKENKSHYLEIVGLYPDYNNEIIITIGDVSKTIYIQTAKLPEDLILPTTIIKNEDKLNNDLYFYTPSSKGYTCAYDINGDVRWYLTKSFIWKIDRLTNGHLLLSTDRLVNAPYYMTGLYEMDMLGKIYFEYNLEGGYHHDYFEMPNGNLLVASDNFENGTVEDYIVEIDLKDGRIVKKIDLTEIIPMEEGKSENWVNYDWFHNNSVWYDEKTNSITLSGRHQDIVVNLDYDTLNINYIIGNSTNFSENFKKYFLTPIGDNFSWQWSQHAAMVLPNGNIFLFDNGNNKSKNKEEYVSANNSYSRGVIYEVDQKNMTIKQIWQYGQERGSSFYSPYISNVEYIKENHYIVHSGGIASKDGNALNVPAGLGAYDTLNSITVELAGNEIIFEMHLPTNNYRTKKMSAYSKSDFKLQKAVRLGSIKETQTSNTNTLILKTKDIDKNYQNHDIKIIKELDRLVFKATFKKEDKVKIILDKFLGKKEYDVIVSKKPYTAMCVDIFTEEEKENGISVTKYINSTNLSGKYSIYISINGTIYKTNKYVEF